MLLCRQRDDRAAEFNIQYWFIPEKFDRNLDLDITFNDIDVNYHVCFSIKFYYFTNKCLLFYVCFFKFMHVFSFVLQGFTYFCTERISRSVKKDDSWFLILRDWINEYLISLKKRKIHVLEMIEYTIWWTWFIVIKISIIYRECVN
jgi:hypothetical protein